MITLILATTNTGKQAEVQAFFDAEGFNGVQVVVPNTLPDVDETGVTFAENARLKALVSASFLKSTKTPATPAYILAEDSGFSVPALGGTYDLTPFPGVQSNRWLTSERQQSLLGEQSFETRQDALDAGIYALLANKGEAPDGLPADYTSAVCLVQWGEAVPAFEAEGHMVLQLVPPVTPNGGHGFGYDRIVRALARTDALTVSHLTTAEKNPISHRGAALQQVVAFLRQASV